MRVGGASRLAGEDQIGLDSTFDGNPAAVDAGGSRPGSPGRTQRDGMKMMKMIRTTAFMAITALAIGTPQQAHAAAAEGPDQVEEARAIQLEAAELATRVDRYGEAAKLYRRAAELFGQHPEAAEAWAWAGRLSYYDGSDRAVSDLRKAAEMALRFGNVGLAAHSFLDAAWVAHEKGMNAEAIDFARRATDLSRSPLLTASDRERIQRRVEGTGTISG